MNVEDCGKIEKNSCLSLVWTHIILGKQNVDEFSPKTLPLSYGSILQINWILLYSISLIQLQESKNEASYMGDIWSKNWGKTVSKCKEQHWMSHLHDIKCQTVFSMWHVIDYNAMCWPQKFRWVSRICRYHIMNWKLEIDFNWPSRSIVLWSIE